MKILLLGLAITALATSSMAAQLQNAPMESLMHTQTNFGFVVHASYAKTTPLFGPQGERVWVGEYWNPQFLHPHPGHDEQGAVFTTSHGPGLATWINTLFDVQARHFQYVYFLPQIMVATIDLHFKPLGAESTRVDVVYTRTALSVEGNRHVEDMTEGDKRAGQEWQQKIAAYLDHHKSALTQ